MGILDSVKGRLGFDDGDRNWDNYSQDDGRYDDSYASPRATRRSATGGSSSYRSSGRSQENIEVNNAIIAQRYADDMQATGTVRPRSSSASSYGAGDNTPLVSYSDIASSRPSASSRGGESSYGGAYSLRSARSEGRDGYDGYGGQDYSSPSTSLHLDRDLRSSMASGSNNSLKDLYAERTRIESAPAPASADQGFSSAFEAGSSTSRNTASGPRRIHVIAPTVYEDVKGIAKNSKDGNLVVIVLTSTPSDLGRRILDFSFGVASALGGSVERLADRVFLLQKGNPLSEREREQLRAQGII